MGPIDRVINENGYNGVSVAFMKPEISYNPMVREINQFKTASQVNAYANNKLMMAQDRNDMKGYVAGYAETLG